MGKALVIVESPSKARTIAKYLGPGYTVEASVGHIRDLPKSKLGVDVEHDFRPQWVAARGKKKIIEKLRRAARAADVVYLAPDPDREGEAIAWHIAQELRRANPNIQRIMFHEVTGSAIRRALEHPGAIDERKVDSQHARRILDRLVGYSLSPLLWAKVRRGLSAGRVQSVAVRLIVDREREIQAFVPEEYWTLTALLAASEPPPFAAKLWKLDGKKAERIEGEVARHLAEALREADWRVVAVTRKERRRKPLPPFTTARLQQEAARKLRMTAKQTMRTAQQLYEGVELGKEGAVGLITYMRTDSERLAPEFVEQLRTYVRDRWGEAYLSPKPIVYKSRAKGAQDAHEAIRPTDIRRTPESVQPFLSRDQYRLYELIWKRTAACQMRPAVYDQTTADIEARVQGRDDLPHTVFRATGSVLRFAGYLTVYEEAREEDAQAKDGTGDKALPPLEEGQQLELRKLDAEQHFTQPPPRFTEATLVRELEERGIGRPSTYATIISTIQDRDYVVKEKGRFKPTELGFIVTDLLTEHFANIVDADFTARMEAELDAIEEGRAARTEMLRRFWGPFSATLEEARHKMRNVKAEQTPTDIVCPQCGEAKLVIRFGKNGSFLGCPRYPECRFTSEFERLEDGTVRVVEPEKTDQACPSCGAPMVIKEGRFGRFLACSRYPDCKTTRPIGTGVACPREGCDGELVEKMGRKRKRVFYGCSRYPKCDYLTRNRPVAGRACPACGFPFLGERTVKSGTTLVCERCRYSEKAA